MDYPFDNYVRAGEPRADDVNTVTGKTRLETLREERAATEAAVGMAKDQLNASRITFLADKRDLDAVSAKLAALDAEIDALNRPGEPEVVVGTIITFEKVHEMSGKRLTYAVVGWKRRHQLRDDENLWSLSGMESRSRTWAELLEFAGKKAWPTFTVLREGLPKR